eukprot:TRINITY_DN18739_c0_g1_i1.p3 TRINITY_DN18739_c0_g1~~TRINITY_DN18739_c0_g1_i1.p3  ORF type:complete len:328 (+),score=-40.12 TRINITY_DN18739_c0_g1_i1:2553-3536(+)
MLFIGVLGKHARENTTKIYSPNEGVNNMTWAYLSSEEGFLGIPAVDAPSDPQKARAVIIPFGLESSVSYGGGTAKGPLAIIQASHSVELFDESLWSEPFREIGIATLSPVTVDDNQEKALVQLENLVQTALDAKQFPFVLGGEHTVTVAPIRVLSRLYPNLVIIHFDAHADLRDSYAGNSYSHAAALRRCLDCGASLSLFSFGIRNISAEEIPYLEKEKHRISIYWAKDKKEWSLSDMLAYIKDKPVYITFDIDAFDTSLMPATGTPEPGGLFWDDVMPILEAVARYSKQIVGADVNELAPIADMPAYDFVAAKLVYKMLSYAFLNK